MLIKTIKNQTGAINILLFPLIAVFLLLIGAAGFGFWAYGQRQDYKDNSDQKSKVAVVAALKVEDTKKDAQFDQAYKYPLKTYVGPSAYGSLHISYPKDWSSYIIETNSNNSVVDAYFHPDFVPNISDPGNAYSLRVRITNQSYSSILQTFAGQLQLKKVTVSPYALPKMPAVVGSRLEGAITQSKSGSMIILPLRDKTLQIWTEASQYQDDFNTKILPNISFSP